MENKTIVTKSGALSELARSTASTAVVAGKYFS